MWFCDEIGIFWCRVVAEAGFCDGIGIFWCRNGAGRNGVGELALCQIVGKIDLVSYLNGKGCEMFIYC